MYTNSFKIYDLQDVLYVAKTLQVCVTTQMQNKITTTIPSTS